MSVTVEISNVEGLRRLKDILGTKNDNEAIELLIEKTVRDHKPAHETNGTEHIDEPCSHDLPDEYWDELFAEPQIPSSAIDRILREEREDRF